MPIKDYLCRDCGHIQEEINLHPEENVQCHHCDSGKMESLPSAHGGYHIKGDNSSSVRPKGAGSRSK